MVGSRLKILHKLMLKRKEVSDGDHSQKTCEVEVFGDYTFVVGDGVVQCSRALMFTVTLHLIL